jgi:hypothetical protein|tara:strand:- start:466 stop:600 length:135 start_codon:yes stop_codon:yes gene_type:complete
MEPKRGMGYTRLSLKVEIMGGKGILGNSVETTVRGAIELQSGLL